MSDERFYWREGEVHWDAGRAADPVRLREAFEEFRQEQALVRECVDRRHAGRTYRAKFNHGDPWVTCGFCGVKIRDATDKDLGR